MDAGGDKLPFSKSGANNSELNVSTSCLGLNVSLGSQLSLFGLFGLVFFFSFALRIPPLFVCGFGSPANVAP